jgi:L-arabinose isomerase
MIDLANLEVWFVAGSQHLYGQEALQIVGENSTAIANALSASTQKPVKIVCKPVMTSSDSIHQLCLDANSSKNCVGLITWMHTFSPARMWIAGLRVLSKPFLHLHTQFNKELPWSNIDMDLGSLNSKCTSNALYLSESRPGCSSATGCT